MKVKILGLILINCFVFLSAYSQVGEQKIKTISNAEYSPSRSGNLTMEEALRSKQSSFQIFDENENLIKYQEFNPSTKEIYRTYKYLNYKGKIATLINSFNDEDELTGYTNQIINSKNSIDTSYSFSPNDEITGVQIYYYDSSGNMTGRIDSSLTYQRTLKWEYEFNDNKEMTKRIAYDKDGKLRDTRTYKYNPKGEEYESDLTRANGDFTLFKSEYNEFGDLTDNIWYDKEGVKKNHTEFEYEYDNFGNWIIKKRFRDGEVNYIWVREIEYHK